MITLAAPVIFTDRFSASHSGKRIMHPLITNSG